MLRCCPSGEILWDIVLLAGGLRLNDPWSLLRTAVEWVEYRYLFVGVYAACGGRMLPGFAALQMGRVPYGESAFSFVGKWGVFTLWLFFCLPSRGQNRFFFCTAKEKAVLDSEKEKVDQWR